MTLQINPEHLSLSHQMWQLIKLTGSLLRTKAGLVKCWASGVSGSSRNSCCCAPGGISKAGLSWEGQEQLLRAAELRRIWAGNSLREICLHLHEESAAVQRFKTKPCKSLRWRDVNWRGFYLKILSLDSWGHGITGKGADRNGSSSCLNVFRTKEQSLTYFCSTPNRSKPYKKTQAYSSEPPFLNHLPWPGFIFFIYVSHSTA